MADIYNISISIADIVIELESPLSAAELGIKNRLEPFFSSLKNPKSRIKLQWKESLSLPLPEGELIYDPGSIWKIYRAGSKYHAVMTYHADGQEAQTQGILEANSGWDDLTLTEVRSGSRWQSLLNIGAGELILRTAIIFTGGIVFHASALDDNGKGIVFIGHSGAGKSTQVEIWSNKPGVIAMNDDRIAVSSGTGETVCYGTPWGGTAEIARNHAAPLKVIFVLEHALENKIEKLLPSMAAPLLLARSFLPYWNHLLMKKAMTNINELLNKVPVYRLRCRPEEEVISLVRSVL